MQNSENCWVNGEKAIDIGAWVSYTKAIVFMPCAAKFKCKEHIRYVEGKV